ncbi:sortase (plasmid) [Rubrobacter marinus]|uniref:Sortase n=1 Tax=Rubrobacter marinus TaxID=2653852 RepID=A0A6G8Q3T2_9ACTN|nr:sortase [Rubrobacter marinus]QIN81116.1 sortase [Rubrobacter marinus]
MVAGAQTTGAPAGPATEGAGAASLPAANDTTMYLTVPKLGLRDAPVLDTDSDAAMEFGAIHLPQTGYPWEPGANTYVSGHRIGFPGTPSDRLFHGLPLLEPGDEVTIADAYGNSYSYAVSETHEVGPLDTWVTNPVPGRDVLSLQTCIEDFGDLWSEGPDWSARYVVQADRVS